MPRGKQVLIDLGNDYIIPVSTRTQSALGLKAANKSSRFSTEKTGKVVTQTSTWQVEVAKTDKGKPQRYSITFPGKPNVKDTAKLLATIDVATHLISPKGVRYNTKGAAGAPGRKKRGKAAGGAPPKK